MTQVMVHILYTVTAFSCALVALLLPARTRASLSKKNSLDSAFLLLARWITIFCIADGMWGIFASNLVNNDTLLYISSFVFHLFAAFTPLVWLFFVLTYIGEFKLKNICFGAAAAIFLIELALLLLNYSSHSVFYVDDAGEYQTGPIRKFLFYAQYANYLLMAAVAIFGFIRNKKDSKDEKSYYSAVIAFTGAPILCGAFQLLYPDAPAYSIGYMLGFCIIYSFVITEMLEARIRESAQNYSANKAKTTFLFSMSHDIRTPLNAILGFTDIAIKHFDEKETAVDALGKIKISSGHLLELINEILEMSRIEAGKLKLTKDAMDLREMVAVTEQMGRALAIPKSINLEVNIEDLKNPYVFGDEMHFKEVLINVISNAIKYSNDGSSVKFTVTQADEDENGKTIYRFVVSDNGIGMSEEFLGHIYETFSREQTSTVSKQEGAGLGMSIVKRIIDVAGGRIDIQSKVGEGTSVTIELPLALMDEESIRIFTRKDAADEHERPVKFDDVFKGKRVLLVEDNELNREVATVLLNEAGMIVETADDGSIAVQKFAKDGPGYYDFILMDIQMPVMNGYEATKAIRVLPGGKNLPIIALSANAFEEDRKKSLDSGMDDHIAKPINLEELLDAMKMLL
mgnify:CR=1 FL=1